MLLGLLAVCATLLVAAGCDQPVAPAYFQTDSQTVPEWSIVTFSDNHDYTIEIYRVEPAGDVTLAATYQLSATDLGLGPNLYVQTKPELRIVGRGGHWFEHELTDQRFAETSPLLTSPVELSQPSVVCFVYLLTEKDSSPVFNDPELLPKEKDLGAATAKAIGIPMLTIRATAKKQSRDIN